MKKVKHCTLDWRYLDTFYKVSHQVELKSDNGYKIDIKQEDRIAQIIIEKCYSPKWTEVEELSNSERDEGGFGSSGV
jgi:dUTP pyrophosphatase